MAVGSVETPSPASENTVLTSPSGRDILASDKALGQENEGRPLEAGGAAKEEGPDTDRAGRSLRPKCEQTQARTEPI